MRLNILHLPILALALASCHSGQSSDHTAFYGSVPIDTTGYARLTFDVPAFHVLDYDGFGSLCFVQSENGDARVEVAVHPDLAGRAMATVADSTLSIRLASDPAASGVEEIDVKHYLFATVYAPVPGVFRLDGAGESDLGSVTSGDSLTVEVDGNRQLSARFLEARCLSLSLGGAAQASLSAVAADSVSVSVGGTGEVEIGGMARAARLSVDGIGRIDATQLGVAGNIEQHNTGRGSIGVKPLPSDTAS